MYTQQSYSRPEIKERLWLLSGHSARGIYLRRIVSPCHLSVRMDGPVAFRPAGFLPRLAGLFGTAGFFCLNLHSHLHDPLADRDDASYEDGTCTDT